MRMEEFKDKPNDLLSYNAWIFVGKSPEALQTFQFKRWAHL